MNTPNERMIVYEHEREQEHRPRALACQRNWCISILYVEYIRWIVFVLVWVCVCVCMLLFFALFRVGFASIIFIWHWRTKPWNRARTLLILFIVAFHYYSLCWFFFFVFFKKCIQYTHVPIYIYINIEYMMNTYTEQKREEKKMRKTIHKQQISVRILLLTHTLRVKLASDIRANISVKYTITEWNCKLYQVEVVWHGRAWYCWYCRLLVFYYSPLAFFFPFPLPLHFVVLFHHFFSFRPLFSHVYEFFVSGFKWMKKKKRVFYEW